MRILTLSCDPLRELIELSVVIWCQFKFDTLVSFDPNSFLIKDCIKIWVISYDFDRMAPIC
jgi:hypothetical protein